MGRLEGKCALITGAARGIGRAFAQRFVLEGARVAIADINFDMAKKTAAEIGKNAIAIYVDVADQESVNAAVQQAITQFGQIDILVNNAAILERATIVEASRESFDRVFAVNAAGTLFMMQAIAKQMIGRGKGGKIINISSYAGRRAGENYAVYSASKEAMISLTQSAALNLIRHGINVNGIAPGNVDTELFAVFAKLENSPLDQKKHEMAKTIPIGRMGTPEELCGAAVFLASNESDYVVGQTFSVDGGIQLQ